MQKTECRRIIAIGGSTGAPEVLGQIITGLKRDFKIPILVTQHISPGFLDCMASCLSYGNGKIVEIAVNEAEILPGHIYLAPDGLHLGVSDNHRIVLSNSPAINRHKPAISYLFRSVSEAYGSNGVGILLSGMGRDGAEELKIMRERGALTIVQDKNSSVIYGMGKRAIELGAALHVLPPDKISAMLNALVE